jgi:hypothetical protein
MQMNHTTKTLAIALVVILAAIVIPGYLYEIKAEAKNTQPINFM